VSIGIDPQVAQYDYGSDVSGVAVVIGLAVIAFYIWIAWTIASKAGYSGALSLLLLIPLVNLVVILIFALSDWPVHQQIRQLRASGESPGARESYERSYEPRTPGGVAAMVACPSCMQLNRPGTERCSRCGVPLPMQQEGPSLGGTRQVSASPEGAYRECEFCKEQMRRGASVCPHCRRDTRPWELEDGVWWSTDDQGQAVWFDEASQSLTAENELHARPVADGVRLLSVGPDPEAVFKAIGEVTASYVGGRDRKVAVAGNPVVFRQVMARGHPEDLVAAIEAAGGTAEIIPLGALPKR